MFRFAIFALAALAMLGTPASPARAQGSCENCDLPPGCRGKGNQKKLDKPECAAINITIETDLDFGRLVLIGTGVGSVMLDLTTGQKMTFGELNDLGGIPVEGSAVITGAPREPVFVIFPTQILMSDPTGATAELRDFTTDLPSLPILDQAGRFEFRFSGTIHTDSPIGGKLRGRIPISVQYN